MKPMVIEYFRYYFKKIGKTAMKANAFISCALVFIMLLSGCQSVSAQRPGAAPIHYYTEIPGITSEEIAAIEALKKTHESFTYGTLFGMELFVQPDDSYEGFTYRFCELLTNLFGIEFKATPFDDWDDLKSKHDTKEVDFAGKLTPTPERLEIYQMSNPITEHALRLFTLHSAKEIETESDVETLKLGFLKGTITAAYIQKMYPVAFHVVDVDHYEDAVQKLFSGEIDAFVEEEDADTFFLNYDEIESKKFFQMVYSPISMSSANKEYAPVISALNKYLISEGANELSEIKAASEREYAKYKLDRLLTEEERAYLVSATVNPVKLALENDNYPVCFYNESQKKYQGIAIDILEEIQEISGIEFEVVTNEDMSWPELLDTLQTGKASMMTQLLHTDEREGQFLWSESPYSSCYYALLSRIDYPELSNFQVPRAKVGVMKNSAHASVFREWFPEYTSIMQYDSQEKSVQALMSGEIDLLMASEFIQLSQTNYYENSGLKTNIRLSTPLISYFGFHKDEAALRSVISKVLTDVDTHAIERSWTSRNFDYQKKAATDRVKYSMAFSAVLLAVLALTLVLFIKNKRMSDNLSDIVAERTSELERQTATLSTIYENIPDIVFTVDTQLIYTSCNPSFAEFVGTAPSEAIGKKFSELFHEETWAKFFESSIREVIESAKPVVVEEDAAYPDGTPVTFETIKTPLFQNGELIGMLGIARNITERKSADDRAKIMLNATPLACNLVDRNFNIIDTNEEAAKLFGLKDKQEYLDRFWEIFPERQPDGTLSRDIAHKMIAKAFREGRAVFEWMHRKPDDGTLIPSELTLVRTLYGKQDVITGYIRDLREHKKMLDSLEHKDSLLQTVNNAASILLQSQTEDFENNLWQCMGMMAEAVKVDRVYIWKNFIKDKKLYCTQIYEWSENAVPQQGTDITIEASYNEVAPGWEETLSAGKCVNGIVRNLSKGEQASLAPQGILSILVSPVFIKDSFWGFVGFDDCTRERVFSDDEATALRSGSIMIASALLRNEMTVDIQKAVGAAQEASRAKSIFLSNMSHEIRTPLNAITGMTAIGKSASDIHKKNHSLEKIEEASIHLLGVINDILDMSKIEANKFELSDMPFDFEDMIRKVISVVNLRIYEKKQDFTVYIDSDIPHSLVGDSQRLAQVITNLLANAIKFTPENGSIRLDAGMLNDANGICTIQINVTDTGVGVDPTRQPYIFDSFEQSDNNTARKFGGTGLGLSISKYIVELMDGDIWLTSELEKGSTFSFTAQIKRDVTEKAPALNINSSDIKILVVDADTESRAYFERMAGQLGVACDTTDRAEEVLLLIEGNLRYDIIFADCNMPDMSFVALADKIKASDDTHPAVVMVSSFDWVGFDATTKGSNADAVISKPLFLSSLVDCINECLGVQPVGDGPHGGTGQADDANQPVSFQGYRLLLAEDVAINREIVMAILGDTGIEIDCAENGIEAVEMFGNAPDRYDMIFMDMQMPEMDGLEATRQIRALGYSESAEVPIVAMTANVFREDVEKCKEAGMNDHIGKPLDIAELMSKIKMYLRLGK